MDTETLFTVREAAAKIGVSESAVRNATLEGRLPFVVKFGRKLIEQDSLAAYQARTQPRGIKSRGRPYRMGEDGRVSATREQAEEGAVSAIGASEAGSDATASEVR